MNPLRGPLLLLAAGLFWIGTAHFYSSPGRFCEYMGNAGGITTGILVLGGLVEMLRARCP